MFLIFIYISFLFFIFQYWINSSKIYTFVFSVILVDFWALIWVSHISDPVKIGLGFLPVIILVISFILTSFAMGGPKYLLNYLYYILNGHQYSSITFQSLFLLWDPFKKYLSNGLCLKPPYYWNQFPLALSLLFLCILKEMLKKYLVLILLWLFQANSPLIFFVYLCHIFLFLILVSLLGMDPKVVKFISPFFGFYVLGWLGSYQSLELDNKRLEFVHPYEHIVSKNNEFANQFTSELTKIKNQNQSLKRCLVRLNKKEKYSAKTRL